MRLIELLVVVVGLTAVACGGSSTPAEPETLASGQDRERRGDGHGAHDMPEGAISFSRQGQTFKTTALGGLVGADSVDGVKVGVYVLQAESPERLKPTGSGPTHLFNLTFVDENGEELIHEASGTVTVTGADGLQRRETFERFESHFQARVRLDHPGDYRLRVDFETGAGSGSTAPLEFNYRWKDADIGNQGHAAGSH